MTKQKTIREIVCKLFTNYMVKCDKCSFVKLCNKTETELKKLMRIKKNKLLKFIDDNYIWDGSNYYGDYGENIIKCDVIKSKIKEILK